MMKKLLCTFILLITAVGFVQAQADIEIIGNSTLIVNGQTAISTTDDTDFGLTPIGTPVVRQFTINNTGTASLFLSLPPSINDLGTGTADFSTTSPAFQVVPLGTTTFDVTFNPSSAGAQSVEISITSSDPDENPFTFNIGGTGTLPVGPDIEIVGNSTVIVDGQTAISPTDGTNFGSTPIGAPVVRQFTINNIGTTDLFISLPPAINDLGTGTADFSTTNPEFQVVPLGTTTFDVTFNPSISGLQTVEISILSNDTDETPFTFNIGGTGTLPVGPDIEIVGNTNILVDGQTTISTTDNTDFGTTAVGTPVVRQFTINNTGTTDLFLSLPPSFTDLGTGTSDWSTTSPAFQVIPAGITNFDVTFNPSVAGAQTVQFSLSSNDSDESPFTFNLGGTGTVVSAPDIEVVGNTTIIIDGQTAISATDHTDFGSSVVGTPVVHQFTINNIGTADLFINLPPSINDLGTGISDWSTTSPSFQIAPAGTTTFDVTFTPSVAGSQTVEFSITSNDPDQSPFTFNLGGTGITGVLEPEMDVFGNGVEIADGDVTPDLTDDTDYGQVDVTSGIIAHTFTIENNGTSDLNLTDPSPSVTLSGDVGDFTVNARPQILISASGSTTFIIEFNPTAVGIRTATVSIGNNDSDENPYTFTIQGEGIDANASAPLLITQYYEGDGNDQWIEVKNISLNTVISGQYFLALYNNFNTLSGTINIIAPDASVAIGTMAPGAVRIFRNNSAFLPSSGNLGSAPVTSTNTCAFDGNDVILISTNNGTTCYDNRIDILGIVDDVTPRIWGRDKAFIKGCSTTEQPNTTFNATIGPPIVVNDYIELSIDEVNNANILTNIALGTQGVGVTTWDGSAWDNETPGRTRRAVINGTYTASDGTFESCDLTIAGNVNFDNGTNNYIEIHRDLTIGGTFIIGDTESLYFDADNEDPVIIGSITKYESSTTLNNINDFTYWSSPVQGTTIESVFSNANLNRVFYWDQSAANTIPGGDVGDPTILLGEWLNASGTMRQGKGYISEGPTSGTYPQSHTVSFTGAPTNGVVTIAGSPHMVFNNDGNVDSDYNLIGNPYPSAIDADELIGLVDNNTIDGTLWFWTHNTPNNGGGLYEYSTDDYATYNLSGGVAAVSGGAAPTSNIGSGQGFMVRAIAAGPGVIFNNAMRLRGQNDQFFRGIESKAMDKDRIWLNIESNEGGAFNQILIGFFENASDDHDRGYDGLKLGANWVSLYSKIDTVKYAIQGLGRFNLDKTVSLGFDTYISEPLTYKLSIAQIEGVLKDNDVYLVDNLLNITHDLKQGDYQFDVDGVGSFSDRFTLQFTKSTLGINDLVLDNNFVVINEDNALRLRSNDVITNIKVYDITGRLLVNEKPNDNNFVISTQKIGQGTILILNATFENGAEVSKKAIKY